MKKLLVVVILLGILTNAVLAETIPGAVDQGKCEFHLKMEKEMTNASKRAVYYTKKSNETKQNGKIELAAAYGECSVAKSDIANSIKDFLTASDTIQGECHLSDATREEIKEIFAYRKGERLTTKIKKMIALKDEIQSVPVVGSGEEGKTLQNNKMLVEQIDSITSSLEKYAAGMKEFKKARAKASSLEKAGENN